MYATGGVAGHRAMHAERLPPGQPDGAGEGGVGGVGVGGVGGFGPGVGGSRVVPMSPMRMSENVAWYGPAVLLVVTSHGPGPTARGRQSVNTHATRRHVCERTARAHARVRG